MIGNISHIYYTYVQIKQTHKEINMYTLVFDYREERTVLTFKGQPACGVKVTCNNNRQMLMFIIRPNGSEELCVGPEHSNNPTIDFVSGALVRTMLDEGDNAGGINVDEFLRANNIFV